MKLIVVLPLLLTALSPVSSLHLCKPFAQAKHGDLTISIAEAEKTSNGASFTFFVEKEGVPAVNEFAVGDMGSIYKDVQKLPLKAFAYYFTTDTNQNKLVNCHISTPGWDNYRYYARASCPVNVESDPHRLTLFFEETAINLDLCSDEPPKPKEGTYLSLTACVRSFSSTVFGTDKVAVKPEHVIRWLDHHIKLGIEKFYLYERNKGELEEYLEPYLKAYPTVRNIVEIAHVPLLSQQNTTFDALETRSYIFDQIMVMNACFARARTENYDYVFHIDYDEYIHVKPELSVHQAVQKDVAECTTGEPNGLAVLRCNLLGVEADVPVTPAGAVCSHNEGNVKTAFNATYMAGDVFFTVHAVNPKCFADSLYIHHLPDAYADRSSNPKFLQNLTEN